MSVEPVGLMYVRIYQPVSAGHLSTAFSPLRDVLIVLFYAWNVDFAISSFKDLPSL